MYENNYISPVTRGDTPPFTLPAWIACAPFEEYLGMTIEEAADGRALLTMPFQVRHAQGMGLMHGGAVTSLADTAVAMAIKSLLPEGSHFVTTDLTLRFHAAVTGGSIRAEARTEWIDERKIEGVAEVLDDQGVKVATFTSRFRVLSRP
jgi:uncharacterized protein (TIGR00369 family)